jgi:hypothetical protein
MSEFMSEPEEPGFMFRGAEPPKVELLLRLADGSPWTLTISAGIQRFIGYYPRIRGIDFEGSLLTYRAAYPAI